MKVIFLNISFKDLIDTILYLNQREISVETRKYDTLSKTNFDLFKWLCLILTIGDFSIKVKENVGK